MNPVYVLLEDTDFTLKLHNPLVVGFNCLQDVAGLAAAAAR